MLAKKIFFFIYSLSSGGAERVTSCLANYLAIAGYEITIITLSNRNSDFYPLQSNIERICLELDINSHGIWDRLWNNYSRIKSLRAVIKEQRPDVVISMMDTANIYLAIAATGLPIAKIGSERIYPPLHDIGKIWNVLRKLVYRRLDCLVVQTEKTAMWVRGLPGNPFVKVIPNPVNYPLSKDSTEIVSDADSITGIIKHTLLAVGRLQNQKGFDRLLTAFSVLSPLFPDWQLVILGEGGERAKLEQIIKNKSLNDHVLLPGSVENIAEWYKSADVFVMTSRYEGFPNTLLEALSYRLPVVSVDCDTGPGEIVRHNVDGLIVPQDNHDALVNALKMIMSDPGMRNRFSEKAIEIRERFSIEKISDMWLNVIKEIRL